MAGSQAERLIG